MERLGLGYDATVRDNPGLVWCSISGFGTSGPYASRPGYDTVGQALSGLLSLLTDLDRPRPMGISLSDHLAGMVACNGILGALVARGRTGKGQRVDTSLLEATVSFCGENAARFFENRKVPNRATRTRQAQVYAFVASDGKPFVVHLSSPAKFWQALTRVAGMPEWLDDPRFASKETRGQHYDALHDELAAVFKNDTRAAWLAKLQSEDVPAAALNTLDEVFNDP
jgi:crotonobetainyl-CoA:carnitine CoA-transferase CaiB-like acyl-CoA transferase